MASSINNPPVGLIMGIQASDTIVCTDNGGALGAGAYSTLLDLATGAVFFGGGVGIQTSGAGATLKYTIDGTAKTFTCVNVGMGANAVIPLPPAYAKTSLKIEFKTTNAQNYGFVTYHKV